MDEVRRRFLKGAAVAARCLIKKKAAAYLILTILLVPAALTTTARAQEADLVATKITGTINVDASPQESFWSQVKEQKVPLKPSNPFGGKEDSVTIKLAHNGTWLFLLAKWSDPSESRFAMTRVKGASPGQYLTNATHYYGDLFFTIFWAGDSAPGVEPYAQGHPGKGGAPPNWGQNDKANMWSWRAYYTDQGAKGFPNLLLWPLKEKEKYSFGPDKGQIITFPYSFAWDLYMNKTGNWMIDKGFLHSISCVVIGDPLSVRARGMWDGGKWTLEVARPFAPPISNQAYSITLEEGKKYPVAFAAADGGRGETEETNSVSRWMSLEVQQPSPDYTLIYVATGVVIVAAITGGVLFRRVRAKKM